MRIPREAYGTVLRECPWCDSHTPANRDRCIECEEELAADSLPCPECKGSGGGYNLAPGRGSPTAIRERWVECPRCEGSRRIDSNLSAAIRIEWASHPEELDGRLIHAIEFEVDVDATGEAWPRWVDSLVPISGSSWVRAVGAYDGALWIVIESDQGRVTVQKDSLLVDAPDEHWHRLAIDDSRHLVKMARRRMDRGGSVGAFLSPYVRESEPVPLARSRGWKEIHADLAETRQDLEALLRASLREGRRKKWRRWLRRAWKAFQKGGADD